MWKLGDSELTQAKRRTDETSRERSVRDNDDLTSQRSSLRAQVNLDHQMTQITSHTIHIYSRDVKQTEFHGSWNGSKNYKQPKTLHVSRDTFL